VVDYLVDKLTDWPTDPNDQPSLNQ